MSPVTAQDLIAISERYFAAWAARDPAAIVALHTDDTRFWTHLGTRPVVGRDAVRAAFTEIFGPPDISVGLRGVVRGGCGVVVSSLPGLIGSAR